MNYGAIAPADGDHEHYPSISRGYHMHGQGSGSGIPLAGPRVYVSESTAGRGHLWLVVS